MYTKLLDSIGLFMYSTNLRICDFQLLCLSLINCSLKLPPVCTMYLVIAEFWVWKHFANTLSSLYFCRLDEIQKRNFRICVLIVNAHGDVLVRPMIPSTTKWHTTINMSLIIGMKACVKTLVIVICNRLCLNVNVHFALSNLSKNATDRGLSHFYV